MLFSGPLRIVQLNSDKCKELRVLFTKNTPEFDPIYVNGKELEIARRSCLE